MSKNKKANGGNPDIRKHAMSSISAKLKALAAASIATTIVLGFTGMYLINSSASNDQLLSDISGINLLQNENQTLNMKFLYDLDYSYHEAILKNLTSMGQYATDAEKYAGSGYTSGISSIAKDINTVNTNMTTLATSFQNRGLTTDTGKYAEFVASDADLGTQFNSIASESEWVDGTWKEVNFGSLENVSIGGKTYRHLRYTDSIPAAGKRDYLILRLGITGEDYTGKVYISNITFDGNTTVDLSGLTADDLSKSYGTALKNLAVEDFNSSSALVFDGAYSSANSDWQEASVEVPVKTYDTNTHKTISYDIYLSGSQAPTAKFGVGYNTRYDFAASLDTLNSNFEAYSKTIAEGTDATDQAAVLQTSMEEIKTNAAAYTTNTDVSDAITKDMEAKEAAFTDILTYDKDIVSLQSQNNELNTDLTKLTGEVTTGVQNSTATARTQMTALIFIAFIIGAGLVITISVYVIRSVQKGVKGFKKTLRSISEGNMTVRAENGSGDEFDEFGQSLNQMAGKLDGTLGHVSIIAGDVKSSGSGLESMAQSTSSISSQMSTSISNIADGASSQAQDVEQSTEQMTQLSDLMEQIVSNVDELDDTSNNMQNASNEATQILDRLDTSNRKMTDGVIKIAAQIDKTNESVNKIKDAISLIQEIASQTNLLSLNASIEAARAGEAGKGFAVVASEIQKLADQSNGSAEAIDDVITNLTNDFQNTMQTMAEVQNATQEQNEKLNETQKQFGIVVDGIDQSRAKTSQIKKSIEECDRVRENVSQLMLNLSAISEEYAASTSETSESMKTLNDTITELLKESGKLLEISGSLENDMNSFVLS